MGKGSNTTTTNSSSSSYARPDDNAYQAYLQLMNRASGVAGTAYQGYGGQETAGINDQQRAGISGVNQQFDFLKGQEQPLSAAAIRQYMDPYTSEVIDATQRDFDVQNERGLSQVKGNAASIGALGGDREAVAAALTKEGQTRAQSPIIAGLRSAGYQNAVNTAAGQQDKMLRAGIAAQEAAKTQFGMGTHEQQTEQAQLTQDRLDYYQQQGYPFQVAQWLAQMTTGVGSQMGGYSNTTGTSTSQGPKPNPWAQVAGLGLTAAGMFAADGGRVGGVHQFADGGALRLSPEEMDAFHAWSAEHARHGYAGGGSPYGTEQTWVPTVSGIAAGRGAPSAPSLPSAPSAPKQQGLSADQMKGIGAVGAGLKDWWNDDSGSAVPEAIGMTSIGSGESGPMPLVSPGTIDWSRARGGGIRNYARSGAVGIGAAAPAYEADDVINPDEPYRMQGSPQEYDAAMRSIDSDIGRGQTATPVKDVPLPPEVMSGRSKPAPEDDGEPVDAPSEPMSYASRPRPQRGVGAPGYGPEASAGVPGAGFLSRMGIRTTPELKQGLLQAGLAMMATRHGGPGSFLSSLGEAGMTGVGAYNQTQANQQAAEEKWRKEQFEREKFEAPYSRKTQAQAETERHNKAVEGKATWGVIRKETDPDTGLSREVYGWIDPVTRKTTEGAAGAAAPAGKPKSVYVDESGQPVTGDYFIARLKEVSPERALRAKQVGDYKVNPAGLSIRGGRREQAIADATAYNPNYDQREYSSSQAALKNFNAGVESRAVRSLNVAIDHLATMDEAAKALKNGTFTPLNQIYNAVREKFGDSAVTNFDSIKQVVSAEIAKAVVGGQTALHDREDMAQRAKNAQSPEQLLGITQQFRKLMAGQMKGLRQTYEGTTKAKNFDDFLLPETKKALKGLEHVEDNWNKDSKGDGSTLPAAARAKLKEGEETTFGNGQTWTLKGGSPVRVK